MMLQRKWLETGVRTIFVALLAGWVLGTAGCSGGDDDDNSVAPTEVGDDDSSPSASESPEPASPAPSPTPAGDDDTTATPAGDDDTTVTPTGDDDTTVTPAGDDDTTVTPAGDDDTTATPVGDDDTTATPAEPFEMPTATPVVWTECGELPATDGGTCDVTAGSGWVLISGTVLTPGEVLRGGQVLLNPQGEIICVGCGCGEQVPGPTRITCPTGVVSPGLIDAREQLLFAQNDPYTDTGERYEQRHDWRLGLRGHTQLVYESGATPNEQVWGEIRLVMGGATAAVTDAGPAGFVRNLDGSSTEGLDGLSVDYEPFPLGDEDGTQLSDGCDYPGILDPAATADLDAFLATVAEGVDATARNEFLCLSSTDQGGQDHLRDNAAFGSAIGLNAADYARMVQRGASFVWTPRSNLALYGDTAPVTALARMHANIALATDWIVTGSADLLRELKCADTLNQTYFDSFFSDYDLWYMVTRGAARAAGVDDRLGALEVGYVGDIVVFEAGEADEYRAVIDAEPKDVALVLRAGTPLYGDADVVGGLEGGSSCDRMDVCGVSKRLCVEPETGKTLAQLKVLVGDVYPAFYCTSPENEPACTPRRTVSVNGSSVYLGGPAEDDLDGDGVPDAEDNCPSVFNPIRPVDNGVQADGDADGLGDACDPCPLDPDTETCTVNGRDQDLDTVPDEYDNCVAVSNPYQADADGDGKGDACDPCPLESNPGLQACPATIYEIKTGLLSPGDIVSVREVLVTGRSAGGFFVQTVASSPDYDGADYSGVYVVDRANSVLVGDLIDLVVATIAESEGQVQLVDVTYEVLSTDNPPPAPVSALPDEVANGGARAAALEAVVVTVGEVTVTDTNPPLSEGDKPPSNEFVVNDVLRVDDLLYLVDPFPVEGEHILTLSGILNLRNGDFKLEPRDEGDVTFDTPILAGFGPPNTYVTVGETGVTTSPLPLTVSLSRSVEEDTFVAVSSSDPASLSVVGGGVTIEAGSSSAPVVVDALQVAESVLLTAQLEGKAKSATVEVREEAPPALVAISPTDVTIAPLETVAFTVFLDKAAPEGGVEVQLSVEPADAGGLPESVVVLEGDESAVFEYADQGKAFEAVVTATLDQNSVDASVTVAIDHLVINEVDYDQFQEDTDEFVEIYNGTGADVSLDGIALVLVNGGTGSEYARYDLSVAGETLPAGGYLVVASSTVEPAEDALVVTFDLASNNVQNGAPDGIALVDLSAGELLDSFAYEGSVTGVLILGVGQVDLTEGSTFQGGDSNDPGPLSLIRYPNGMDTDDSGADWVATSRVTPGSENVLE